MKKYIAIAMVALIILSFAACGNPEGASFQKPSAKHDELITKAIEELKEYWRQSYEEDGLDSDGYFEIKNTRIITIKENEIKQFRDVAYIIEFELYTNYFGSAPYYENVGVHDNVIVYQNGTMEVVNNLIAQYRSATFQTDCSGFIEKIDDYHGQYNCIETL